MEVFLKSYFQFFVARHLLIFRETSDFMTCMHIIGVSFQIHYFSACFELVFFFIADVYFYMYYGYLYRNFFQTYFALYKFFAVILYMWSLEIHSNIFYIMLFC